jgi:hypothetical protein
LHKVFNALREEGVTKHDVATALHVHPEDVDELVFGLALTALQGDGRRAAAQVTWPVDPAIDSSSAWVKLIFSGTLFIVRECSDNRFTSQ